MQANVPPPEKKKDKARQLSRKGSRASVNGNN